MDFSRLECQLTEKKKIHSSMFVNIFHISAVKEMGKRDKLVPQLRAHCRATHSKARLVSKSTKNLEVKTVFIL